MSYAATHEHTAEVEPRTEGGALAPWGFAISLATLATAVLYDARLGINWGIWILCVAIAFIAMVRERFGTVGAPSLAACAWAVVLAFGPAVTSDPFIGTLLVLGSISLMAVALIAAGETSLEVLQLRSALVAPIVAFGQVFNGALTQAVGSIRGARSPQSISLARSAAITIPIVTGLVFLLAEADPLFAAARDGIEHILPADFFGRAIFFAASLAFTLGAFGAVLREHHEHIERAEGHGVVIGSLESRVLMSALAVIMWIFVADAAVGLLKNPAAIAGSGITYAEYVHRGFAELSVSATLIIGVVLVTRRSWLTTDAWTRRLAFAAIAGESGMIAVAFMRVLRYEQAYGFTDARLHAQAYMLVLACLSALILFEIARRTQSSRFAFHGANAALVVLASCVYYNTGAWIVRHNFERYAETGKIDVAYLANQVSRDGRAELVAHAPLLHGAELADLNERLTKSACFSERAPKWFEWNLRTTEARAATADWYRRAQPNCPPPS